MTRARWLLAALLSALAVLVVAPGAGDPATAAAPPPGVERVALPDGRSYLLALPGAPAGAGAGPVPLLTLVHGRTSDAADFAVRTGAARYAAAGRAVVVLPQATRPDGETTAWDAGACCAPAAGRGLDELGYLTAVQRDAVARAAAAGVAVDGTRRWYVGFSNGAMLGYRVACERPGLVDAVVAVGGARATGGCGPVRPVPFLHVHGADDGTVRWAGTPHSDLLGTALPGARDSVAAPARAAGCTGWTQRRTGDRLTLRSATGCSVPVALLTVAGLTHHWPGDPAADGVDGLAYAWGWLHGT